MSIQTIAFIPVRGGSKSIPKKNIQLLGGQPLLHWTLKAAVDCPEVDRVVVATDSDEIAACARLIPSQKIEIFHRSAKNADDKSSTESVILEFLAHSQAAADGKDQFILIQATNPFLQSQDISKALKKMKKEKAQSLLSCVRTKRFFWSESGKPLNYDFKKRPRRQDFAGMMMENGAFYISTVGAILKHKNRMSGKISVYEMSEESGFEIDEPSDWIIVEGLLEKRSIPKSGGKVRDFSKVKLFLTDVDGVLTDAGMYYSPDGDALKRFSTIDGMGIRRLQERGTPVGIITGENTPIVAKRAEKLKVKFLKQGIENKLPVVKEICKELGITLEQVAYVGDDVNDLEVLSSVGIAACPQNAVPSVKSVKGILHLQGFGGHGAVREFIDLIMGERK